MRFIFLVFMLWGIQANASILEEIRDYKFIGPSQVKASLGPGSTISDGDVINNLEIVPSGTVSIGSVALYDGTGSSVAITVFSGGTLQSASPILLQLDVRANGSYATYKPRWLITTGASVSVLATGTFH